MQAQRQTDLEKTLTELAEENRQARAELTHLANVMERILKELATRKTVTGAGASGQGGQSDEPPSIEREAEETEEEGDKEPIESEEDRSDTEEAEPEEPTAPTPAAWRSRRNV